MSASITLFLHRLDESPPDVRTLGIDLAPDELERARQFHFAEDRCRWLAGRAWIRQTLGSVLGRPPASLAFSLGKHGKPRVVGAPLGFECNWSHSGNRLALAVSESARVGVDLEVLRHDFPALEVAHQFFTRAETKALEPIEGPAQQRLFLRLWTAKEALMKATGAGVSLPPDKIEVNLSDAIPTGYATHPEWQLAACEGSMWAAAVAWPTRVGGTVEIKS